MVVAGGIAAPTCRFLVPACQPTRTHTRAAPQKHTWTKGLTLRNFEDHSKQNEKMVAEIKELSSEPGSWGLAVNLAADGSRLDWRATVVQLLAADAALAEQRAAASAAAHAFSPGAWVPAAPPLLLPHTCALALPPACTAGKYDKAVVEEEDIPLEQRAVARAGGCACSACCLQPAQPNPALTHACMFHRATPTVWLLLREDPRAPASAADELAPLAPLLLPLASANWYRTHENGTPRSHHQQPLHTCTRPAGKMDAKKRLEGDVQALMSANIVQCMGSMLDTIVF